MPGRERLDPPAKQIPRTGRSPAYFQSPIAFHKTLRIESKISDK